MYISSSPDEIVLRWIHVSHGLDELTLVLVVDFGLTASSHDLNQCRARTWSHDITRYWCVEHHEKWKHWDIFQPKTIEKPNDKVTTTEINNQTRFVRILTVFLSRSFYDYCPRMDMISFLSLQWYHDGRDSVSNQQPHDCLLNRSFRSRSKKTSKLRVTGLCAGNSPVAGEFPAQRARNAENAAIWWRHHNDKVNGGLLQYRISV